MPCSGSAIRIKKTRTAAERDEEKREQFRLTLATIAPERLVFLDECGVSLALYWLYGWAKKSERCVEKVPCQRGVNRSLLGALSLSGINAFVSQLGGFKRDDFEKFLAEKLLPTLAEGSVIVLDNARIHHGGDIAELVATAGCSLLYLPPYSPDMNPIELAWGWIKGRIRRICARNDGTREKSIEATITALPREFIPEWFRKCGALQS